MINQEKCVRPNIKNGEQTKQEMLFALKMIASKCICYLHWYIAIVHSFLEKICHFVYTK